MAFLNAKSEICKLLTRHGDTRENDLPSIEFWKNFHIFYIIYEKIIFWKIEKLRYLKVNKYKIKIKIQ